MAVTAYSSVSPFLHCGSTAQVDSLAILHLKRDLHIPTVLRAEDHLNEGYDEGKVTNTRFGSFPHSTLIGAPWGSQVRASAVDTGSRGRKGWEGKGKKRKRNEEDTRRDNSQENQVEIKKGEAVAGPKAAKEAKTGFVHLLPPTPEIWTASLPHRTQVVYTPDYSYILHRIRARPGTVLIEAGAGSGSFTHAAARAVYNGPPSAKRRCQGKVYSFEFHEQRARKLKEEIREHGLPDTVTLAHQDVCSQGFIPNSSDYGKSDNPSTSINATSIFLDLPAPWLALKHLTRHPSTPPSSSSPSLQSPLSSHHSIHLCTFSPCIEQVTRTVSTLRSLGWTDISMVEISAKRIEVRRERVGIQEEGLRGVNDHPADVSEALQRLREVEGRTRIFHEESAKPDAQSAEKQGSKQQRLESIRLAQADRKLYKEGRLLHKSEPELKTHTSYLVFAILPREWSEEDEREAQKRWPSTIAADAASKEPAEPAKPTGKKARKLAKKAAMGGNKVHELAREGGDGVEEEVERVRQGLEDGAREGDMGDDKAAAEEGERVGSLPDVGDVGDTPQPKPP